MIGLLLVHVGRYVVRGLGYGVGWRLAGAVALPVAVGVGVVLVLMFVARGWRR